MELSDFIKLGLKEFGDDKVEIYWYLPNKHSPSLKIRRGTDEIPLDPHFGERGFILGYYVHLVRELLPEYKERCKFR